MIILISYFLFGFIIGAIHLKIFTTQVAIEAGVILMCATFVWPLFFILYSIMIVMAFFTYIGIFFIREHDDNYAMCIYYGKFARKYAKYVKFADHVENMQNMHSPGHLADVAAAPRPPGPDCRTVTTPGSRLSHSMRFESHFKSSFGNCKRCKLN